MANYQPEGKYQTDATSAERPASVETREELGHWEGDTVIGAHHKQAIVTLVERMTGLTSSPRLNANRRVGAKARIEIAHTIQGTCPYHHIR